MYHTLAKVTQTSANPSPIKHIFPLDSQLRQIQICRISITFFHITWLTVISTTSHRSNVRIVKAMSQTDQNYVQFVEVVSQTVSHNKVTFLTFYTLESMCNY
jgi:hypothetical protein